MRDDTPRTARIKATDRGSNSNLRDRPRNSVLLHILQVAAGYTRIPPCRRSLGAAPALVLYTQAAARRDRASIVAKWRTWVTGVALWQWSGTPPPWPFRLRYTQRNNLHYEMYNQLYLVFIILCAKILKLLVVLSRKNSKVGLLKISKMKNFFF
jgi:hypothetical protein